MYGSPIAFYYYIVHETGARGGCPWGVPGIKTKRQTASHTPYRSRSNTMQPAIHTMDLQTLRHHVDTAENFYDMLRVTRGAISDDIRKNYHQVAWY